jgi:hypothetical protein
MAGARMPEAFFAELKTLLPADEPVGPEGSRPRVSCRVVIKVLCCVLVTGCRWEDVPLALGCSGCVAQPQGGISTHAVWIMISAGHRRVTVASARASAMDIAVKTSS